MSIAVLTQVYDEMRRLAIAGSVVAAGDFRLKRLLPALTEAGAKAPVFARVAEAVSAVVGSDEKASGPALLELTTLVNAILYTQGETGATGTLEPIDTANLWGDLTTLPETQAGARLLKPLLEALSTTGSGRMELIRDAHERGAFRDLRLVRPALGALDDGYAEIADFIADNVLPLYGTAILPELRGQWDVKGRGGHARRLRLMHQLDPTGTHELVKQALDSGSKEVKVAAVECLGGSPDDLSYLLEQATAKAQEVRQAAYRALATVDNDAAVAVLQKALSGKDLELAADSLRKSRNARLLKHVIAGAEAELTAARAAGDKKEIGPKLARVIALIHCLAGRDDKDSEAFLLKVFAERDALAKLKGDVASGADLNSAIVRTMAHGGKKLQLALVEAHASLPADDLRACFDAALHALPADKVYDIFAPYVLAEVDDKKRHRNPAWVKCDEIITALISRPLEGPEGTGRARSPALDPRWLDAAMQLRHLRLIRQVIRPGQTQANAFLTETFHETLKAAKHLHDCHEVVAAMVQASHPDATNAFIAVLSKFGKKTDYVAYWFAGLTADLPKSAIPQLEALIPDLSDRLADHLLGYIQQLRAKP